ncbi:MAG: protein-disulfide reductase DsbD family protein [Nonlabens sp.]|uniref:protein-disulfide reductase DsbD family protein n=1 Tax=Nonlabens sp. TaxID=1888209 RepID=UPI003EF5F042
MRKLLIALTALISLHVTGQVQDPTDWTTSVKKLSDTEYVLVTDVSIEPGWHLYSQAKGDKDEGPVPTEFNFFGTDDFELVGINEEKGSYAEFEKVWEMDVYHFANYAHFEQKVKLKNPDVQYIAVESYFMVCDDTQCLPPSPESLIFKLDENVNVVPDDVINAFYDEGAEPLKAKAPESSTIIKKGDKHEKKDVDEDDEEKDKSLWIVFFLSFLGGFAALLTPCMFPMIPLTVSFFTKQSQNRAQGIRNAILYGVFIIAIYVLLGSAIVAIFGIEALNELSTSVTFNIAFFVILVVFALSFLGAFEITLPQSWANSADKQSNRGGIIGIFFMALALAIISFSCTGPIVGSILFESSSKGGIAPIIGMLGFSSAIALPFALFAIFPGWMNSLPKSGGWLNTVKVFLGFLELAFAFKFLSNADLVMQWGLLTREVFLVIWVAIFGTMALYLFGKIKLPHDGPEANISVGRLLMGIFSLCVAIYLLPGIWGAPLKIISGFPPPMKYSESPYGVGYTKSQGFTSNDQAVKLPEGAELGEYDIVTFHDYDEGLAYAKKIGKPALVDFTGHACVNCRRMEQLVWGEQGVLSILKGEVVMISLYVDEKKKLPIEEHYMSEVTEKMVRTTGNKWSELQIKNYQINAQPYYALIGADGKDLIKPVGYTPDAEEFEKWLNDGVEEYK